MQDHSVSLGTANRRLIRWPEYRQISGLSRSTRFRLERDGILPERVQISPGCVGWWLDEVLTALENLPRAGQGKPRA